MFSNGHLRAAMISYLEKGKLETVRAIPLGHDAGSGWVSEFGFSKGQTQGTVPASNRSTLHSGTSDSLAATTDPADPPPITMKS